MHIEFQIAAATFGAYVLSDPVNHVLTPSRAFVSLSLLNVLRQPMVMLPNVISSLVQLMVSNKRLQEYFVAEELDPNMVDRKPKKQSGCLSKSKFLVWPNDGIILILPSFLKTVIPLGASFSQKWAP